MTKHDAIKHLSYKIAYCKGVDRMWVDGVNVDALEIAVRAMAEERKDVVEVVRCRDCVYRSLYPNSDKQYWCNQWNTKANYKNGYCYRGRKDND